MSNIPPIIENLVDQLNDASSPLWLRNNAAITLDQIVQHCQKHLTRFNIQATRAKAKEARKK
jgi:hypothetical protein